MKGGSGSGTGCFRHFHLHPSISRHFPCSFNQMPYMKQMYILFVYTLALIFCVGTMNGPDSEAGTSNAEVYKLWSTRQSNGEWGFYLVPAKLSSLYTKGRVGKLINGVDELDTRFKDGNESKRAKERTVIWGTEMDFYSPGQNSPVMTYPPSVVRLAVKKSCERCGIKLVISNRWLLYCLQDGDRWHYLLFEESEIFDPAYKGKTVDNIQEFERALPTLGATSIFWGEDLQREYLQGSKRLPGNVERPPQHVMDELEAKCLRAGVITDFESHRLIR